MDKKIVKRAGGGAGINFKIKEVDAGDLEVMKNGNIANPGTWKIGEFDALGYMDGMTGVDGSKVFDVIWARIIPDKKENLGRSVSMVSGIDMEDNMLWAGWIRGGFTRGMTIEFDGYCDLAYGNSDDYDTGKLEITASVTEDGVYWYQDVFENASDMSDEDILADIKDNLEDFEERYNMTDSRVYLALKTEDEKAQAIFNKHEDRLKDSYYEMVQDDTRGNYGVHKKRADKKESKKYTPPTYEHYLEASKKANVNKKAAIWAIYSKSEDGYWNNEDGWGEESTATLFEDEEKQNQAYLPGLDAKWVELADVKFSNKQARKQRIEAALAKKSGKATESRLLARYDESEYYDSEVKYRVEQILSGEDIDMVDDVDTHDLIEKSLAEKKNVRKELEKAGLFETLEQDVRDREYESDGLTIYAESFVEGMDEILEERGAANHYLWDYAGMNMDWRGTSKQREAIEVKDFEQMRKYMAQTDDFTMNVYDLGNGGMKVVMSHHDAPTGSVYVLTPHKVLTPGTKGTYLGDKIEVENFETYYDGDVRYFVKFLSGENEGESEEVSEEDIKVGK